VLVHPGGTGGRSVTLHPDGSVTYLAHGTDGVITVQGVGLVYASSGMVRIEIDPSGNVTEVVHGPPPGAGPMVSSGRAAAADGRRRGGSEGEPAVTLPGPCHVHVNWSDASCGARRAAQSDGRPSGHAIGCTSVCIVLARSMHSHVLTGGHREIAPAGMRGWMFLLLWNTFSGSYFAFTSASRP